MTGGERTARNTRIGRLLYAVYRYALFFVIVAFVVTCCMMLFVSSMVSSMGLTLTQADIQHAAKLTLYNVLLLTTLFTVGDGLRQRFLVERPVRQIVEATERMMQGDFSVRIPPVRSLDGMDGLQTIASCFNKMAQELSGTETLRTDFIANVSHELKTPLTVIKNYASILAQPGMDEAMRLEYARAIGDTSTRLANLITNILKLNKLENQQIFPASEVYNLSEQLCACLLAFEDAWEKKSIDIQTDMDESVWVRCDEELLTLVWNNLFSNAIKFTDAGGTISLTLKAEGDNAVVTVADTGCGFGSDVGRHIFEKFYQGDSSRATQGNGLGLALVKRVVDIVGGDIKVESEVGKGSAFTVRLERIKREAA